MQNIGQVCRQHWSDLKENQYRRLKQVGIVKNSASVVAVCMDTTEIESKILVRSFDSAWDGKN